MYDVTAIGELLIDFTFSQIYGDENAMYVRNPGGAPANLLSTLAKFNKKTAFIGKVGNDEFGHFLQQVLKNNNVDTKGLVFSQNVNTTLAFVHLDEYGDRSFSFYRNPGADMTLEIGEIDKSIIKNSRVFHFGSVSTTHEPSATATLESVKHAKESGSIISYDPNLRIHLWDSIDHAKEEIYKGLKYADILKISEEEFYFITGNSDLEEGTQYLYNEYNIPLIFVTLGANGCFYRVGNYVGFKEGISINSIDTTGAGDAFLGAVLYKIIEKKLFPSELNHFEVENIAAFANTVAAISTTKKGGIPSLPSLSEIELFSRNILLD